MSITSKRDQLTGMLIKELGNASNVKEFSQMLRDLDICDLRNDKDFINATKDGGTLFMTLITWYQLGFMSKMLQIKQQIKGEQNV